MHERIPEHPLRIDTGFLERREIARVAIAEARANDREDVRHVLELFREVRHRTRNLQPLETKLRRELGPPLRATHPHDLDVTSHAFAMRGREQRATRSDESHVE